MLHAHKTVQFFGSCQLWQEMILTALNFFGPIYISCKITCERTICNQVSQKKKSLFIYTKTVKPLQTGNVTPVTFLIHELIF
jgi:hypothetical protein